MCNADYGISCAILTVGCRSMGGGAGCVKVYGYS